MNRKDIALTVAGVLATMALAYLFYRQQQATAAAAAAPVTQDVNDPSYADYADPNYAYQYAGAGSSSIPSVSVPTYTADSISSVDTSAGTGAQASSDYNDLLSQIIAAYHGGDDTSTDFSSLAIPAATVQPSLNVTNIPQTAADALTNASNMLGVSGTTGGAVSPPSTTPVGTTSAGQNLPATSVHYNHILSTAVQ